MQEKAYEARLSRLRKVWKDSLPANTFSLDEGHYSRSSGGAVAYALLTPERASHRITILFHGTGNDLLFTWQPMIQALLAKGRTVLLFDFDGHGQGSSTTLIRAKFGEAAVDLHKFLESKSLDTYPYELMGYSLGALAILHAVFFETLKPDKFVLLALPLRIRLTPQFVWNELRCFFSKDFYRQWIRFGWRETIPAFGAFRRRSFPLRLESKYEGHYPSLVDALLLDYPPLAMIQKFGHNCLLVFGDWDRLAPPSKMWDDAAAEILVIDRANHFLLPFHKRTIEEITAWIG